MVRPVCCKKTSSRVGRETAKRPISISFSISNFSSLGADASAPRLLKLLIENDIEIGRLAVSRPTLDDVFLQHTGRTIRSDNAGGGAYDQPFRPSMGRGRPR